VAACGDGGPTATEEAEAGVAAAVAERLASVAPPSSSGAAPQVVADCPDDVDVTAGVEFRCQVAVGDAEPVELALVVGEGGRVELRQAVIPTAAAEAYLADELAVAAEGPVTPDCGERPLLVVEVGDELRCEVVRDADGVEHSVVITVLAADGTVRYRVERLP
jgi:hypothetical protein